MQVVLMKSSSSAVTLLMSDNHELSFRNQTSSPEIKMDAARKWVHELVVNFATLFKCFHLLEIKRYYVLFCQVW
jgi:hypothetical protein